MALNRCGFQIDGKQATFRKTDGVQFKATSVERRFVRPARDSPPWRHVFAEQTDQVEHNERCGCGRGGLRGSDATAHRRN
jgi:hypothetical protein